jgi:hypothetical protein
MKNSSMKNYKLASLFILLILSACGGGGGSETPQSSVKPVTPVTPVYTSVTSSKNVFGAWLWYAKQLNKSHEQIASEMAAIGVKRIYIKIADGRDICSVKLNYVDVCDKNTAAVYKAKGIEPWTWSYNYNYDIAKEPNAYTTAAGALSKSVEFGYMGHVVDIETEFDGKSKELEDLLMAFSVAREKAKTDKLIDAKYLLTVTTWANPVDHNMNIAIIDKYVDAHQPQTYLEEWAKGGKYANAINDPIGRIAAVNQEYRSQGSTKPIWHIVSTDANTITPTQLTEFFKGAGPYASIWRIPDGTGVPLQVLDKWKTLDWTRLVFTQTSASDAINYVVK